MCTALPAPRCAKDAYKNWMECKERLDLAEKVFAESPNPSTARSLENAKASFMWRDSQLDVVAAAQAKTARIHLKQEQEGTVTLTQLQHDRYQLFAQRASELEANDAFEDAEREGYLRKTIIAYQAKGEAAFGGNARLIKDMFAFWQAIPELTDGKEKGLMQLTPDQERLLKRAEAGDLSKDYLDRKSVNVSGDPREKKTYAALADDADNKWYPTPLPPKPGSVDTVPEEASVPSRPVVKVKNYGNLRTRS